MTAERPDSIARRPRKNAGRETQPLRETKDADFSTRPAASVEMTTGTEERIAAVPAEPRNDGEEAPKRRGRPPKNAESKEQAFSMFDEG